MRLEERAYAEETAVQLLASAAGGTQFRALAREAPGAAGELNALAARVEGGAPLDDALAAAPRLFPPGLREIARVVGPKGLHAALDLTRRRRRALDALVDEYVRPLVYPLAVAAFIAFVAASFERFVVPIYRELGMRAAVPLGMAMDLVFLVFLAGFLVAGAAAGAALSERPGRAPLLLWTARVFPGAGATWARIEAGLALREVAAYLRAGLGLGEALSGAEAATRGAALRAALRSAAVKALAGTGSAEALAAALPPGAADALAAGSSAPLPDALDETGAWIIQRALAQGAAARNAVHIATVLAAAALAATVLLAAYLPIFRLGTGLPA